LITVSTLAAAALSAGGGLVEDDCELAGAGGAGLDAELGDCGLDGAGLDAKPDRADAAAALLQRSPTLQARDLAR
jgi:hypothetical protein